MHLYMQHTTAALPGPRFIRLYLEQDLLGSWELIQETGQLGGKSQVQREIFIDQTQALEAIEMLRMKYAKRGFEVLISMPDAG